MTGLNGDQVVEISERLTRLPDGQQFPGSAIHRLIQLPEISDSRGTLTFAQEGSHIPFTPRRIFTIYNCTVGAARGGHSHKRQHQALLMTGGECIVDLDHCGCKTSIRLNRPSQLLYVPPMIWLDLRDFTEGGSCLVLASECYDETDYIRDYSEFLNLSTNLLEER